MFDEVVLKHRNKVACHRVEMQPALDNTLVKVVSMPVCNDKPPHSNVDAAPFVLLKQRDNCIRDPPGIFFERQDQLLRPDRGDLLATVVPLFPLVVSDFMQDDSPVNSMFAAARSAASCL